MDFFECLNAYLLRNRSISKSVGDRIYPQLLPQEPMFPAIVYTPVTAVYDDALQRHTGFVRQIVQFTIHDTTFGKARATGRKVKAVLQDFKGDMAGIQIQATHTLTDVSTGGNTTTQYDTDEYTNTLEFEFDYMEE